MEKGSGDPQSVRHGRLSSCYKHYTQSITAIWLLVFMTNLGWVLSTRNTAIVYSTQIDNTLGFRGVWNETLQRSIKHCLNFHVANVSDYFYYWPEDDPNFHFCCEFIPPNIQNTTVYLQDYQNLSDYTYTTYGYYVGSGAYYDLGLIDNCFPFWNCKRLYQKYLDTPTFAAGCEYQDVISLFHKRFRHLVIWEYGLLKTALPAIALLELCVFLIILGELLYMRFHRYVKHFKKLKKDLPPWTEEAWIIFKKWFACTYCVMLMDWLHICLLSFVGNGLLDAVGRADPFLWTSKLFYNYTRVYIALLIVLLISSALQQVAQWIAMDKSETWEFEEHGDDEEKGHALAMRKEFQAAHSQHVEMNDPFGDLQELLRLTPDWKWQPIAAQAAILFCVWGYLTYIVTENTASTVLGFVVQAASPWSGLYSLRVSFITVPYIISRANNVTTLSKLGKKLKSKFWHSKLGKKLKSKFWHSKSGKDTKPRSLPTMIGVDDETRNDEDVEAAKRTLTAEQGPIRPQDDVDQMATATRTLTAEQDPLPPQDDVLDHVATATPEFDNGIRPIASIDVVASTDVVGDTETSNLRLEDGPYSRRGM